MLPLPAARQAGGVGQKENTMASRPLGLAPIRGDDVPESDERFEVVISNPRLLHADYAAEHPTETPIIEDGVATGTIKAR